VEKALEESEEKYRTQFEGALDAIFIADAETGILLDCNRAACKLVGRKKSELVGQHQRILHPPQEKNGDVTRTFKQHLGEKAEQTLETQVITKKGQIKEVAIKSNVLELRGRRIIQGIFRDITERKRGEEELRRGEEKYRAILENIVEGYFEIDLAGNFTFVNDPICNNLGYTRDELIGMNNREYMDKQTAREVFEKFVEVYTTGIPARGFEFENIRKDGTKLVTSSSVSLVTDSQGKPTGFRGVVRNITAEKKAEEELRRSEEKYRTILENVVEGYYKIDLAGNFTFVNDSICYNMGYTRDELIGMNNRDYMDKQTAREVLERFAEVYTTGIPARGFDFEVIRKDGTKLFVSSSVSLIRDSQGQPTGFQGVTMDVTKRRQVEEKLRRSEEKYRTILENITDGYYEIDLAGNFTFFNNSLCQIIGYPPAEMMGMNNRQYMDKENARKMYQTFNKVYTTGKPARGFDWELIRKDGTKRFVEASVSLVRNPQGEPAGFRGVVRDITERKQMEAEKEEMERKAQLATRLSAMGEMASGIIHEINNPLTSVVGFAEILADKDLPEDAKEYATIINNEGKRVASIAGRLLNFARRQKPEIVYTDINKLIEDTTNLQSYEMTTGNIKVTAQLDPHLPQTMADPGQLQQVFLNITLNARTALRAAHGGGKLLVKTEAIDSTIRISFKDDGPGIPKENLKTIFNPFFTTRKTGEGTGLGLSICRGIISSHKGMIYVESTLGKGATFIIELPVVARQKTTQAGAAIDKPRRPARVRR